MHCVFPGQGFPLAITVALIVGASAVSGIVAY